MCPCCSCVTAEANDKFTGGRAYLHDIPCYDPSTQAYLGTLPAMTPDEVGSVTFGAHNAHFHQRNQIWTFLMSAHAVRLRRPVPALRQFPLMQRAGEGQDQGRAGGVAGDTSVLTALCHGHVPSDACAEMQFMREQYCALEHTCSIVERSSNPYSCDCNASRSQPLSQLSSHARCCCRRNGASPPSGSAAGCSRRWSNTSSRTRTPSAGTVF